uniref:Uncharacterized protein n=1 Tax=Glossina pallidipes TaxID=7398 RepID=A0A1B0AD80_GLOPL
MDSVDRKGKASCCYDKHRNLSNLWDAFETIDDQLPILFGDQLDIEYFNSQYYEQMQAFTVEYLDIFNKEADHLKGAEVLEPALKTFLAGLTNFNPNEPQQFYTVRIDTISKLCNQVEDLYDQAWEQFSDPLINGLDQDNPNQFQSMRLLVSTLVEKMSNHLATTSNATFIKTLHDTTQECLFALNNIGIGTKEWDTMLVHILINKLDRTRHIRFEQSLRQPKELPSIGDLLSFWNSNSKQWKQ